MNQGFEVHRSIRFLHKVARDVWNEQMTSGLIECMCSMALKTKAVWERRGVILKDGVVFQEYYLYMSFEL